jgi:hypothetical protein
MRFAESQRRMIVVTLYWGTSPNLWDHLSVKSPSSSWNFQTALDIAKRSQHMWEKVDYAPANRGQVESSVPYGEELVQEKRINLTVHEVFLEFDLARVGKEIGASDHVPVSDVSADECCI